MRRRLPARRLPDLFKRPLDTAELGVELGSPRAHGRTIAALGLRSGERLKFRSDLIETSAQATGDVTVKLIDPGLGALAHGGRARQLREEGRQRVLASWQGTLLVRD